MKNPLQISPDFALPLEAVTETFLDLGQRGSGKTNTAAVIAEELFAAGAPFVVLTPIDNWWGLKSSANGKGPGLPIYIFGGKHADLPLSPTAGRLMADVLIEQRISCVLCTQGFSATERAAFVTDLAERLLDANTQPLHVIVEEADAFIPQKPFKGEERMLGAMDRLIRWGRSPSGIGGTFISQRSAKINKDVTTQCSVLLAHRTMAKQDIDAIKGWFEHHPDPEVQKALLSKIASMPKGSAFIYSPAWLEFFGQIQMRRRNTFDSAATPKLGQVVVQPKKAEVDLKVLEARMAETIERVKAEDPALLKKEIARLRAELKKAETFQSTMQPAREPERIEVPVFRPEHIEVIHSFETLQTDFLKEATAMSNEMITELRRMENEITRIFGAADLARLSRHAPSVASAVALRQEQIARNRERQETSVQRAHRKLSTTAGSTDLGKCERAILQVLSQNADGCTSGKLTLLAGYRYSGGFKNSLSILRQTGLIVGGNTETMHITDLGLEQGPFEPLPEGEALIKYWLNHSTFGQCERTILNELVRHRKGLTAEQLLEKTGYQYSGGFKNSLSTLRTAGVIVGKNTEVMRVSDTLFE